MGPGAREISLLRASLRFSDSSEQVDVDVLVPPSPAVVSRFLQEGCCFCTAGSRQALSAFSAGAEA